MSSPDPVPVAALARLRPADVGVAVTAAVEALLRRSDDELLAAQLSSGAEERFLHAHLAAVRAGAALLQAVPSTGRRRGRPRPVWELVPAAVPGLQPWTAFFASNAPLRAALEAGRAGPVGDERADAALAMAEDFQDAVRLVLGLPVAAVGSSDDRAS